MKWLLLLPLLLTACAQTSVGPTRVAVPVPKLEAQVKKAVVLRDTAKEAKRITVKAKEEVNAAVLAVSEGQKDVALLRLAAAQGDIDDLTKKLTEMAAEAETLRSQLAEKDLQLAKVEENEKAFEAESKEAATKIFTLAKERDSLKAEVKDFHKWFGLYAVMIGLRQLALWIVGALAVFSLGTWLLGLAFPPVAIFGKSLLFKVFNLFIPKRL